MKQQLKAVEDFHNAFLQEMGTEPRLLKDKESQLRYNLMDEENKEYIEACREADLIGIADALGDQLYILCGTILKHGMQYKIEEVFTEIHRSNMSKLGADSKPVFREDGKILKGPGYFKPNIKPILLPHENV